MINNWNHSGHKNARVWSVLATIAVLIFATNLVFALPFADKPDSESEKSTSVVGGKHGHQIFETKCMVCHNKQPGDNAPFGPPNLYEVFKDKAISVSQAEDIITHGKGQMPAFGTTLSKSDMASVIAYIKSVR